MDLDTLGFVVGMATCFALFCWQKDVSFEEMRRCSLYVRSKTSGLAPVHGGAKISSSPALEDTQSEAVKRGNVEASPELQKFLKNVGQLKLLSPLTQWGARTPADLKHLIEEDYEELGISRDNEIRQAIQRLEN